MDLLVPIVLGVAVIVAVTVASHRLGIAAPLLLVVVGVAVSFIPAVPDFQVPPELIIGVVLPPLLYSAAVNMPAMDFRRDFRTISGLSVALVVITSFAIAVLLVLLIPSLPFAIAVAIGAIVSPTDAVATAIVRRIGVSNRIVTVLEGESMLNDATALVLLRSAIAVGAGTLGSGLFGGVTSGTAVAVGTGITVVIDFVFAAAVAVAIGYLVGRINLWIRARVRMATANTAISFLVPFAAALPAEALGASGLVAAVVAGLITGHGAPKHLSAEDRMTERTTWRTIELLLEGGVFLVMGLQLSALSDDVEATHDSWLVAVGLGGLLAVVILVTRTGFVATSLALIRWRTRRSARMHASLDRVEQSIETRLEARAARADETAAAPAAERDDLGRRGRGTRAERMQARARLGIARRRADLAYYEAQSLGWREGVVLVWAGMRGAVTLAAAQTLPTTVEHRSLLLLVAFVVAASTLLIQGATLGWVARALRLTGDPDEAMPHAAREQLDLRRDLADVALARLDDPTLVRTDGTPFGHDSIELVRHGGFFGVRHSLRQRMESDEDERPADERARAAMLEYRELRLAIIEVQRQELLRLRSVGEYSSEALSSVLTILDADQLGLETGRA